MADPIALSVSVVALAISGVTAWLTLFRKGTVCMTQPTVIFFGPDAARGREHHPSPKIYLRTLLFSTSKRGRVIESMHASLHRNESQQTFNVWVYGDSKLVRGSGLFVGETGVAANHHFLAPKDGNSFQFLAGIYHLKVYARLLGDEQPKLLFHQMLEISPENSASLKALGAGLYFDWGADSSHYLPHIEERASYPDQEKFMDMLTGLASEDSR